MRLIQFLSSDMRRNVGLVQPDGIRPLKGVNSLVALAEQAWSLRCNLAQLVENSEFDTLINYQSLIDEKRILNPVSHRDPAHSFITGTGLTHLGSATARDSMHTKTFNGDDGNLSDSMKIFNSGIKGGKPTGGLPGVQPEWFYKGDGTIVVPPEGAIEIPSFALDGGEEPEVAGIYLIAPDGTPLRIGFALGNEFSDHTMERQNYLYLAHSKLRSCSFGPELLLGPLPPHLSGTSRILRDGQTIWEKPFLSGEENMCHSIANLEHHHFKYDLFRRPGDLHVHYFGTATLSYSDGINALTGDVFEIEIPDFGRPLRNGLIRSTRKALATVIPL